MRSILRLAPHPAFQPSWFPIMITSSPENFFTDFAAALRGGEHIARLRADLVGDHVTIPGPFGPKTLVYADYVASGRALGMIEQAVMTQVLPYYANSHTEASFCGQVMNRMRHEARQIIARLCGAEQGFATIFTGNGATAGLNRLVHLLGVRDAVRAGARPLVLVGPYEHHSNILPWRESGAELVEIAEALEGGPDLTQLEACLAGAEAGRLIIGAFSAASNVTGIVTETDSVTRILKKYGAKVVWDYAGGGPYLPIDMKAGTDAEKDAVVVSAHKFIGGPAASGVLIVREAAVATQEPTLPGGGTVRFVSPWGHEYSASVIAREEAGTPDGVGNIRAALCFLVKEAIGADFMAQRNQALYQRASEYWQGSPYLEILGSSQAKQHLPIFSFRVRDASGARVHHQLFTRMLSDLYGIQARGGCACAGPYAHRLLGVEQEESMRMQEAIRAGQEVEKPGWVRLNFSVLMDDAKVAYILESVRELAENVSVLMQSYTCDVKTARFRYHEALAAE